MLKSNLGYNIKYLSKSNKQNSEEDNDLIESVNINLLNLSNNYIDIILYLTEVQKGKKKEKKITMGLSPNETKNFNVDLNNRSDKVKKITLISKYIDADGFTYIFSELIDYIYQNDKTLSVAIFHDPNKPCNSLIDSKTLKYFYNE